MAEESQLVPTRKPNYTAAGGAELTGSGKLARPEIQPPGEPRGGAVWLRVEPSDRWEADLVFAGEWQRGPGLGIESVPDGGFVNLADALRWAAMRSDKVMVRLDEEGEVWWAGAGAAPAKGVCGTLRLNTEAGR